VYWLYNNIRIISLRIFTVLGLFVITPAWGQEVEFLEPEEPQIYEDSSSLLATPKIMVTTPWGGESQEASSLPVAFSAISRSAIRDSEFTSIPQSLQTHAGVGRGIAEELPNYWNQGVSVRGLGGPRLAILSSGVSQELQGLEPGGGNIALYDPLSIERIELLRGSQTVALGGSASGGVINVIGRTPSKRDEFGISSGLRSGFDGSSNAVREGAFFDFGNEKFGLIAGGSYTGSGRPILPGEAFADNGSYRAISGWSASTLSIGNGTSIGMRGEIYRTSDLLISDKKLPPSGAASDYSAPQHTIIQAPRYQRSLLSSELLDKNPGAEIELLSSRFSWQQLRKLGERYSTYNDESNSELFNQDTVNSILWDNTAKITSGRHSVKLGYDLGYESSDLKLFEPSQDDRSLEESKRLDASRYRNSLFAEHSMQIDSTALSQGARIEHVLARDRLSESNESDLGISAELGAVYRIDSEHSAYLRGNTSHRAPNLDEQFIDGREPNGLGYLLIRGDRQIDAERNNTVELGAKRLSSMISYSLATYFTSIDNYIARSASGEPIGSEELEEYRNVGSTSTYGVELDGGYKITEELEIFVNSWRAWSEDRASLDLPSWIFNYGVRGSYELCSCIFLQQFTGVLSARSVSASTTQTHLASKQGKSEFEGFTALDFEGALHFAPLPVGDLRLVFGARNITNERYREPFYSGLQPGLAGYVAIELVR
jgi:outer membrane receptor protein involved in Fe transport